MAKSLGIRRPHGVPSMDWLRAQTVDRDGCWIWTRTKTPDGYGRISIAGRDVQAHRVAYEIVNGPAPCWLIIDHLCRRRDCINPAHLEAVTHTENVRRGVAPSNVAHQSGVCAKGHPLVSEGDRMRCKVCQSARQREWYERKCLREGKPIGTPADRRKPAPAQGAT